MNQTPVNLKPSEGKSTCVCKSKQVKTDRKRRVTRIGIRGMDRCKEGSVKARSTGCDHQPAAAKTQHVHPGATRQTPAGLSNFDRNTHRSPSGPAPGSKCSLKQPVRASGCGDCRHISPRQKSLGEQGQKSSCPGPEKPRVKVKIKKESTASETSKKIVIWIDQYPKVTLCDISQKCDALSHDCGFVLPDVLKTKIVRCVKKDMRAGFRFVPACLGHNKQRSEESAFAKNRQLCPRVQSEKTGCQSLSLTKHQRDQKQSSNIKQSPSYTAHCYPTSEGSATCSASCSLGKCTKKGECRTGMWERDVEEDPGKGSRLKAAETHRYKRIKLGDGVIDGVLPSILDLESLSCKGNTNPRDKEITFVGMSNESLESLDQVNGDSISFSSAVKKNLVHKKPCGEIDDATNEDVAQMSSELLCQSSDEDTDEPESFTCQRVRAYFRTITFSCARTYMLWPFSNSGRTSGAHAGTDCVAESVDPSARNNGDPQLDQPGSSSNRTNDMLPKAFLGSAYQVSHRNEDKQPKDGNSFLAERNGKGLGDGSSCSMNLMEVEESLGSRPHDVTILSNPSPHGRESVSNTASYLPLNAPETSSSMSTPSPSALGLTDWETATTLSPLSSPFTHGSLSSLSGTPSSVPPSSYLLKKFKGVMLADAKSKNVSGASSPTQCVFKAIEKSSSPQHNSDSLHSHESSLLLPQDEQESDEDPLIGWSPPKLEPYYKTNPVNYDPAFVKESPLHTILSENGFDTDFDFILPPMLSPVTTPHGCSVRKLKRLNCSNKEHGEEIYKHTSKHKIFPGCHTAHVCENSVDFLERGMEEMEGVSRTPTTSTEPHSSPRSGEAMDETDCEDDMEQRNTTSELVPPIPKIKATISSGALTEPCSSSSSDEDDAREKGPSPSEITGSKNDETNADDTQDSVLDEFAAYEQDILLVDVIQDDPDLFENLPQESLLKLGPTKVTEAPKTRQDKRVLSRIEAPSPEINQRSTPVILRCDSPDSTEESRSWRPQCSSTPPKMQGNAWLATERQTKNMGHPDANNNHVNGVLERSKPIQRMNSLHNHISPLLDPRKGPWITIPTNMTDSRRQKSNAPQYCRQYFSESLSCGFKMCRFQHVPVEGDEKLCIETVTRFTKNPMCLQKAGAVFTGYYQNNPPGVYFSMPVLLSLLWSLLKARMVSDVFSVLSVSLAHKIVPGHEFLLALFGIVREKGFMGFVPELMQLIFKMASSGLVLSLDCLDCVKNTPEFQQMVNPDSLVSGSDNNGAPLPEYLSLAHSIVEIELCTKQEDWRRMGEVFRSICQSSKHNNQAGRISGRIAIALLSESKDKLSLPFAAFADTVCQSEGEDSLMMSFLGRIGVSLMLRYHKTHQWAKGRKVVEVLSHFKVNYSTLKGLFGNEDGASRCCLVTVATELFLLSGSLEGALNTLRENKWFLSSPLWPCKPADLESRTRVLMRLAEKTSYREALEVLCNLPGLKEPNDLVDISKYGSLFNSQLQVCLDKQILPVASDTVGFMLCKKLPVDQALLQMLLHKLGKQNLWLRAREVFRNSLSEGYYTGVSAPPGVMALTVPCGLGEVELAITLEMFITVNATGIFHVSEATTSSLRITLKRTQSCESEYLSAGSRILSAACIPQPKLAVHYTAVNSSQEQVFTLDISSARCWLRHNHMWANEVWTH